MAPKPVRAWLKTSQPGIFAIHHDFISVNDTLFFSVFHSNGNELWKSDGTEAGTIRVKDIQRTDTSSGYLRQLTGVDGTLFFNVNDGTHGYELWKSDGTEAGTVLVKDINPGLPQSYPRDLTNVAGTLFFAAEDNVGGFELWKSDGTEAGTVLVRDIQPGLINGSPGQLTNVDGTLFFIANDGTHGYELWSSDGTEAGTTLVTDIRTGSISSFPENLTNVDGTLLFVVDDGTHGRELWKSDGTESGTMLVKDIRPGPNRGIAYNYVTGDAQVGAAGGRLFFLANEGVHGNELWMSDGSEAGTVLVRDITDKTLPSYPSYLTYVGDTLIFRANDGIHGNETWRSDGTQAGTVLVKDVTPDFDPNGGHTKLGESVVFAAGGEGRGEELWKTDGTEAGTVLIKDINRGANHSSPTDLTKVGDMLFFNAMDGRTSRGGFGRGELWKSDGTEAGTVLVKDIRTDVYAGPNGSYAYGSNPRYLTDVNGTLFFVANDGIHGAELWQSDGTVAGTMLVKDINPGSDAYVGPRNLVNVNGTLFFTADDGTNGRELWKSNGTELGTVMVRDIFTGSARPDGDVPNSSQPSNLINVDGTLFFNADDGVHGSELWQSDGSTTGTVLVKDINPGAAETSYPTGFASVDGKFLFSANDGDHGT